MKKMRGFSRLELMVVVVLLSVVSTMLLNRLRFYQEAAEKAQMEYTVSALKSALRMRMATLLTQGRAYDYASLALENPMDWLAVKPPNYTDQPNAASLDPGPMGVWYFDRASRTLGYLVGHGDHFQLDSTGQKRVRLHMTLVKNAPAAAYLKGGVHLPESVALVLVEPYRWF